MSITKQRSFWQGFAAGAASGTAAGIGFMLSWKALAAAHDRRILRIEESLQIGCPVNEVFAAWTNFSELPKMTPMVRAVEEFGRRSHWIVELHGKRFEWEAELTQKIPNQSIGWNSRRGPKHSGRITFSPLASDTLVHITMNYAPPFSVFAPSLEPMRERLEGAVKRVLRDFKASLENMDLNRDRTAERATGTRGAGTEATGHPQYGRLSGAEPVEYARPPEAKPLSQPEAQK